MALTRPATFHFLEYVCCNSDAGRTKRRCNEQIGIEWNIWQQQRDRRETKREGRSHSENCNTYRISPDLPHLIKIGLKTNHEKEEDDTIAREHVDSLRHLHDLAALRSGHNPHDLRARLAAKDCHRNLIDWRTRQRLVNHFEHLRSFTQNGNQVNAEVPGDIPQQNAHQEFAKHRRLSQFASGKSPDDSEQQYTGNA